MGIKNVLRRRREKKAYRNCPLIGEGKRTFDRLYDGIASCIDSLHMGKKNIDGTVPIPEWAGWTLKMKTIFKDQDAGFPSMKAVAEKLREKYGSAFDAKIVIDDNFIKTNKLNLTVRHEGGKGRLFLRFKRGTFRGKQIRGQF